MKPQIIKNLIITDSRHLIREDGELSITYDLKRAWYKLESEGVIKYATDCFAFLGLMAVLTLIYVASGG